MRRKKNKGIALFLAFLLAFGGVGGTVLANEGTSPTAPDGPFGMARSFNLFVVLTETDEILNIFSLDQDLSEIKLNVAANSTNTISNVYGNSRTMGSAGDYNFDAKRVWPSGPTLQLTTFVSPDSEGDLIIIEDNEIPIGPSETEEAPEEESSPSTEPTQPAESLYPPSESEEQPEHEEEGIIGDPELPLNPGNGDSVVTGGSKELPQTGEANPLVCYVAGLFLIGTGLILRFTWLKKN